MKSTFGQLVGESYKSEDLWCRSTVILTYVTVIVRNKVELSASKDNADTDIQISAGGKKKKIFIVLSLEGFFFIQFMFRFN